jgi:hypothetical protein
MVHEGGPHAFHSTVLTPTHSRINCIRRTPGDTPGLELTAELPRNQMHALREGGCTPPGAWDRLGTSPARQYRGNAP